MPFSPGSLCREVQLHTSLKGKLLAQLSVCCVIKQVKPELFFFFFPSGILSCLSFFRQWMCRKQGEPSAWATPFLFWAVQLCVGFYEHVQIDVNLFCLYSRVGGWEPAPICQRAVLAQLCTKPAELCSASAVIWAAVTNSWIFVVQEIGKGLGLARSKSPLGVYRYTSNLGLHHYSNLAQGGGGVEAKMEMKGSLLCMLSFPCYFNFKQ